MDFSRKSYKQTEERKEVKNQPCFGLWAIMCLFGNQDSSFGAVQTC